MKWIMRHKSGVIFAAILSVCILLSIWLSHYIPDSYFDNVLTPILLVAATTIAIAGACITFKHSEGLRVREVWGYALLTWGVLDGAYIISWIASPTPIMNMGAGELNTYELLFGNLLCWVMLLYPAEALRPGWINWKRAFWQLMPMYTLVAVDYILPSVNLAPIVALYPFVLLGFLLNHMHAYQVWCEENFSTLDDIDLNWIMRYMIMAILLGLVYVYMCSTHSHTRGFTQQWLVIFMLAYSTEQILFRPDPWAMAKQTEKAPAEAEETAPQPEDVNREKLEKWMEQEKPYLNPGFKLLDLQAVLPMNRTYLSQFIHTVYGCTFYQFVNRFRIEEAMRMKQEKPDMKISDISAHCGYSSPTVFSRTFTEIVGVSPREWAQNLQ